MADIGKWLEGKVQNSLATVQERYAATYYRFPDTHAARNLLPSQPGDHLFIIYRIPILIEEKCSEEYTNFRSGMSSLWGKKQAAFHRKWHRAGACSVIVFCDYSEKDIEIWDGNPLARARAQGKRIPVNVEPIHTCHITDLPQGLVQIANYFKEVYYNVDI